MKIKQLRTCLSMSNNVLFSGQTGAPLRIFKIFPIPSAAPDSFSVLEIFCENSNEIVLSYGLPQVIFAGQKIGEGIGRTRREAQHEAAQGSLMNLAGKILIVGFLIVEYTFSSCT